MQSLENIWLNLPYLKELKSKAATVFSNVKYCQCYMPSYTSGQLGLIIATMDTGKIWLIHYGNLIMIKIEIV